MRPPDFWWRERPGIAATLLRPVGAAYGAVTAARMARPGWRAPVPVLCVGNFVAGGAGKTPVALAVAGLAREMGQVPAFVSRGYGRDRGGQRVIRVDPDRHRARECGDEPLLLARVAPTYVSADRRAAAAEAARDGATVVILDDGLQNPALAKNGALAVVDGGAGFGNGLCIPAGPLRAPAVRQWPHVDLVCVVGDGLPGSRSAAAARAAGRPVTAARLGPEPGALARLRGRPLFAFAGIGRPDKFFATLAVSGLDVRGSRSFPDHHRFAGADLSALRRDADEAGAGLVTTAKDRVRLPPDFPADVLPVDLAFDEPDRIGTLIRRLTNP